MSKNIESLQDLFAQLELLAGDNPEVLAFLESARKTYTASQVAEEDHPEAGPVDPFNH